MRRTVSAAIPAAMKYLRNPLVRVVLGIFAIFFIPYGMKYGWTTPLWYFPLMLLTVLVGFAIGSVLLAASRR